VILTLDNTFFMDQELTPGQQKQEKKAKAILWIGLVVIAAVGLAIVVYFIFSIM